ncbi:hypothetical protein [Vibrio crassostreae]|uniref:hypothetical protein n=1 Tax=Vibrio crassostreae TaxID=246167 RepID=UPI001B312395|nr:hypothetical protein [Vibrio crassostreae]
MSYAEQLSQFSDNSESVFQAAVNQAAKALEAQFNQIITNFIEDLNSRYKRHCFIFTDSMGSKGVYLYSRTTGELLCWWAPNDYRFDEKNTTHKTASPYRDYNDLDLNTEIQEFVNHMSGFECTVDAGYYFNWEGKQDFDHVTDRLR